VNLSESYSLHAGQKVDHGDVQHQKFRTYHCRYAPSIFFVLKFELSMFHSFVVILDQTVK
jgi:hypothetical protein